MASPLGETLTEFHKALSRFRQRLGEAPEIEAQVFAESKPWLDELNYKLIPHLAGEGCLIAAVSGGTNTGKSTIFNLLVGAPISPMRTFAAATSRSLLVANVRRTKE